MNSSDHAAGRLRRTLYAVCVLTDFSAFMVIFAVSRALAEAHVSPWRMGLAGAGLSFSAGIGSILAGWLAHRWSARGAFLTGSVAIAVSIAACALGSPRTLAFLPSYWLLGIGLGFLYPPLVGWLNQKRDTHGNRRGVSRILILYCIAWNLGMMCGQFTAGALFARGKAWIFVAAGVAAALNLALGWLAVSQLRRIVSEPVEEPQPEDESRLRLATQFQRIGWIANLGGMFGGSMVVHLLPDLAVTIGVPSDQHGSLLAAWRAVIIGTYLLLHVASFWHYRFSVSVASQGIAAVGLLAISLAESPTMLLVGLALLGQLVGFNYFSGLFYGTAGSAPERRAWAAGLHEATLAAGMAIGTILGGALGSWIDHRAPYRLAAVVMGVLLVAQAIAWWRWVRPLLRTDSSK